ncbi:MAG: molecular chaperone HscC [Vicinamibacteria bacterium]
MKKPIVGIDLGTTNSLVAIWKEGEARVLSNVLGCALTPSVVGVDDDGRILVGQAAKERLLTHPHLTVGNFKRSMGTTQTFLLGGPTFRPEELSSLVLRSLKADAEAFLGHAVEEAVISVPAYFNDAQRKATRTAGVLAGLAVERLINEPTAAAMAYGMHEATNESTFLVFDLGGGTFDVSVLEIFDGVMEVHASAGDNFLGGEDFVTVLEERFSRHVGIDPDDLSPIDRSRLRRALEETKLRLSAADTATVQVRLEALDCEWTVSRAEFESAAEPLVERMRAPIERALRDARLKVADLDAVVLVGGATRMPLVRALAARLFGRFPLAKIHPDEAVARGAAIQAGLKSRDEALSETVLTDICPYSLGVAVAVTDKNGTVIDHEFSPILERNTIVPTSCERHYSPIHDEQTAVRMEIYQGESRKLDHNIFLGSVTLPLPRGGKARERSLLVRFTYDINGLLEVEARVAGTEICESLVIEGNPGTLTPDEILERLRALECLKVHPREQMENRTLLARGERLFEESLGDLRLRIGRLLGEFEAVLESQAREQIERAQMELRRELDRLEQRSTPW